jgi:FtsP/CotA-like multicopper oxidase with cupredoxin domain
VRARIFLKTKKLFLTPSVVTLGIGQRTDVLVRGLDNPSGSYAMRSKLFCSLAKNLLATAIINYGNNTSSNPPNSTAWPALDASANSCNGDDLSLTTPLFSITPDPPSFTQNIDIEFVQNSTGFWQFTMNKESFRANYNNPILLLSNLGNNSYPDDPQWNVYNFGSNTSVVFNLTNPGGITHPIHLHGHNMFVLKTGTGVWDGSVVNAGNPQRRDVQLLPAGGFLAMQLTADNPGAWPLHCHIGWHVSIGLYITVLERPDDIAKLNIPPIMAQTCRDWATWTGDHVVDQIDSGL